MTALAWLRTHLGALATWPLARIDAWATGWIETIHEPDDFHLWAEQCTELEPLADALMSRATRAIEISRPRREGEIG